jgi:hypothetical protein
MKRIEERTGELIVTCGVGYAVCPEQWLNRRASIVEYQPTCVPIYRYPEVNLGNMAV